MLQKPKNALSLAWGAAYKNKTALSRQRALPYALPLFLFFCLCLAPSITLAAPVVFYTDIVSGPKTGGENNNGVYLSIFGKGFGTTRGTSTVKINGIDVAAYNQWGAPSAVLN